MPKSYVVDGTEYRFPDEMNDQQVHDVLVKQGVIKPPTGQHWSDTMGLQNPVARGAVDLAEGAASGLASTIYHGGDLIRRGLGMERIINKPEAQQAMTPPDSLAGKAGKFIEQGAEFMLPAGAASKAMKAASVLPRMAAQAGIAAGVAGVQTGGDPKAMGEAALLGGAGEGVAGALGSTKASELLRTSAEKQYARAINATKEGNKWVSQNIAVPELLDRGVSAMTLKGLKNKATDAVQSIGKAIGDAWSNLPAGSSVEMEPMFNRMEAAAKDALTITDSTGRAIPATTAAKTALANMDYLKQTLMDVSEINPASGKLEVPVDKLRQLRQAWDEVAAQAKVYQGKDLADAATGKIHAMAADAVREELGKQFPDIASLNKEYSFWKSVEKVVGDTVLRREGQTKPLSQRIAGAAGAAVGGAHGGVSGAVLGKEAMEGLQTLANSTMWRTVSAVQKAKLAKYISQGNPGAVNFTIKQMLRGVGLESISPGESSGPLQPALAQ